MSRLSTAWLCRYRIADGQARAHGTLCIVLVRHGIAEIGEHSIAEVLRDHAAEALDLTGAAAWKPATTSRCSSGSSRVESALEPTMSQNITVSCRRSGVDPDWVGTWAEGSGFVVAILVARLAPHSAQNLALSEPTAPQVGHVRGKAEPHSAQNLAAAATSALQLGHSTFAPSIDGLCMLTQSYWCEERRSEPD